MLEFSNKDVMNMVIGESLSKVLLFYRDHKDIFTPFSNQKEKREIIKKIYSILGYDSKPQLNTEMKPAIVNGPLVHRGISASSKEELISYIKEFISGEVFYGGRASIYGTGIYTVVGEDRDVACKYATDGNTNDIGIVITSVLKDDAEIIYSDELREVSDIVLERLKKAYKNMDNYLSILEDDGAFAAILGYDAIYVKEKEYMVILNRSKLIVYDNQIMHDLNRISEEKSR